MFCRNSFAELPEEEANTTELRLYGFPYKFFFRQINTDIHNFRIFVLVLLMFIMIKGKALVHSCTRVIFLRAFFIS
jgi:hypothetical protein